MSSNPRNVQHVKKLLPIAGALVVLVLAGSLVWAILGQARIGTLNEKLAAASVSSARYEKDYEQAKPYETNVKSLQSKASAAKSAADAEMTQAKTDDAQAKTDKASADAELATIQATTLEDGDQYSAPATMKAGTYRTTSATSTCYWEVLNGDSTSQDIVSNSVDLGGNFTVTVNDGQTFDSRQCGNWVKIG